MQPEQKSDDQLNVQDAVKSQDKRISQDMVLVIPEGQEEQAKEQIKKLFYTDLVHPVIDGGNTKYVGYIKQIKIGDGDPFEIRYDGLFSGHFEEKFKAILEISKNLMNKINDNDIKEIMRKINEKSINDKPSFQDQSVQANPDLSKVLLSYLMSFVENNDISAKKAIKENLNLIIHAAAARKLLINIIDKQSPSSKSNLKHCYKVLVGLK